MGGLRRWLGGDFVWDEIFFLFFLFYKLIALEFYGYPLDYTISFTPYFPSSQSSP